MLGNNTFAYCNNNPVIKVDNNGYAAETVWDVISLCSSAVEVALNPADPWAWAGLVGDIIDVAIPFVGGIGEVTRAIGTTVRVVDKADDVIDAAKVFRNTADAASDIKTSTGTYVVLFESGKNYVGKGSFNRAITSATEHATDFGDTVSSIVWAPTSSSKKAFMAEYMLQSIKNVGRSNSGTYNIIWSPGKKIVENAIKRM